MNPYIVGLLAETMIHSGQGKQQGILDLPVSREKWTDYPFIAGSALKGAFREKAAAAKFPQLDDIFGSKKCAAEIGFSDARLLLLPVRSLHRHYFWVTCPYLLERYLRDLELAGRMSKEINWSVNDNQVWVGQHCRVKEMIYLEEFSYYVHNDAVVDQIIELITPLIHHESVKRRLREQVVVISDDEFHYFAQYSLPIQYKNRLSGKKTSESVWQEENLPPDTIMYALLIPRVQESNAINAFGDFMRKEPYLQIGGKESTGLGWFVTRLWLGGGQ
ncbi:type III-B CRISPR module RAMP protein Cmr4 [Laceyella tengchongensis]|jgi:CRISPR-associated protein Cmr4